MLKLYTPKFEDLWFRQQLMIDEATMSYNHAWGGTIDFPESSWQGWYDFWIENPEGKRFYRYLQKENWSNSWAKSPIIMMAKRTTGTWRT